MASLLPWLSNRIGPLAVLGAIVAWPSAWARAAEPDIAFGTSHAVVLRSNGDVLTWGNNTMCELGRPTSTNTSAASELVLRNATEIAVASQHTLALTSDGKVYGWGTNAEGVLGTGSTNDECEGPKLIEALADKTIVHIATGHGFSLAVTNTGDLYCTGDNSMGQCPVTKNFRVEVFTPVTLPGLLGNVAAVRAGSFHALVLTREGALYAFGRGRDGQLGNGRFANGATAAPILTNVSSFAAGTWHSAAVQADGTAWAWGNNAKAQLCDGTTVNRNVPTKIPTLPGQVRAVRVAAVAHTTVLTASDGSLHVCGDNQLGLLAVETQPTVPRPTRIPFASAKGARFVIGGANAAFSPDGCALRLAGYNNYAVVTPGATPPSTGTFVPRANLSLCAQQSATGLPNIVHEAPHGGRSNCWAPRKEEDASKNATWAGLRQAMLVAESILQQNAASLAAPVPVRMRTSRAAGPYSESGARMHVKSVPERKPDGTRIWTGDCDVIPQIDRIGGPIGQVSVFFNTQSITEGDRRPQLTGRVGGYPEYNGWVLITKDGRLPWIPQTVAEKLDAEGARRETALAEWNARGGKGPYNTTASLEQQVADYKQYRASLSTDALEAPAVWGDASGEGKRKLDTHIAELRALSADEQKQVDDWGREAHAMERQAQVEAVKNHNPDEAARLRGQSNDLANKVRAVREAHLQLVSPLIEEAMAHYQLANITPGDAENAMSFKPDPTFPDFREPNRIQVITVAFFFDTDPTHTAQYTWGKKVKETFDWATLAALLK